MLGKMGKWFGIIFKIIIPLLAMYRPIKTLSFSIVVFGIHFWGNPEQMNNFGTVAFIAFYVIFFVLLLLCPKIASAIEFILIAYYFAFFVFAYIAGNNSAYFASVTQILYEYIKAAPIVLLFLSGKIFFFFFVRKNYMRIAQMKFENSNTPYNSEDY
jgi:hypothetical protein